MSRPTVVINGISYDGGQEGYRVILCDGADVFGEDGEHVAETIAESGNEIEDAVRMCKLHLQGWEAIENADLEWLWENRPDRIGKSAFHFAGAILEDVEQPSPPSDTVASIDSESEWVVDYPPSTTDEGVNSVSHSDSSDIPEDDCGHLPEYRQDGECLRCQQASNTAEERDPQDGVVS